MLQDVEQLSGLCELSIILSELLQVVCWIFSIEIEIFSQTTFFTLKKINKKKGMKKYKY